MATDTKSSRAEPNPAVPRKRTAALRFVRGIVRVFIRYSSLAVFLVGGLFRFARLGDTFQQLASNDQQHNFCHDHCTKVPGSRRHIGSIKRSFFRTLGWL